MHDFTYFSSESSEYEMRSETLDKLYKEQLQTLRDLMLKQNNRGDIELCRKWMQVFNKTSKNEKMARNCLSTLMQQQLAEAGCLGAPFTDVHNCNRDLNTVLSDLDALSEDSHSTLLTAGCDGDRPPVISPNQLQSDRNDLIEDNETKTQNVQLRLDLEALHLQLTEKQIENMQLRATLATVTDDASKLISMKQNLLTAMTQALEELRYSSSTGLAHNIFERVFRDVDSDDSEFRAHVRKMDELYEYWLIATVEQQQRRRLESMVRKVAANISKAKQKVRQKYEQRLRIQNWAQRLEMKLVKMKCFSALRRAFIDSQGDGSSTSPDTWELLRMLEEKYQEIVNEIV